MLTHASITRHSRITFYFSFTNRFFPDILATYFRLKGMSSSSCSVLSASAGSFSSSRKSSIFLSTPSIRLTRSFDVPRSCEAISGRKELRRLTEAWTYSIVESFSWGSGTIKNAFSRLCSFSNPMTERVPVLRRASSTI